MRKVNPVFLNKYYMISNLTRVEKEIVLAKGNDWKHFIIPAKGTIKVSSDFQLNSLNELQKRKQISIKEVLE